ncbi:MAG TPA: energy transducer TonB [Candidatus Sulfopaludibacter sp.]|nr:energy transducer TonB [Candidatus Sulfopaludibacter sp.]
MQSPTYVWNDPERPVSIHLSIGMVRALSLQALEGLKSVPRRGLEIGGLLLGHTLFLNGRHIISIENYEAVESEHRSGPSYLLSDMDRQHFADAIANSPKVVGMFRTQTRDKSLELQPDDTDIFAQYFTGPDALFLLIHPAQMRSAFFRAEAGRLVLLHELPFRASDLPGEEMELAAPAAPMERIEPAAALVAAPSPRRPSKPPVSPWLVGTLAVLTGGAAGILLVHHPQPQPTPAPAPVTVATAPAPAPAPDHVPLRVEPDGTALRLVWDSHAPAIQAADSATLDINDGRHNSTLHLDTRELSSGMVSYWPETKDVSFRLQVVGKHPTDDSIRAVGGQLAPFPAAPVEVVAVPKQEPPRSDAKSTAKSAPPPAVTITPSSASGDAARATAAEPRPSPFVPDAQPVADTRTPAPAATARPPVRESEPNVTVEAEPVSGSKVGRVVSRIPLLRRLRRPAQPFVPPTPLHQVKPSLSSRERNSITDPVLVSVRVYVTKEGKVDFAELLSAPHRHAELANPAIYAARHWDFTPARLGDEHVEGEVILHFRFAPPEPPHLAAQSRN